MIFVFGSNEAGRHGKGAAAFAAQYYGAKLGVGVGRTGDAYALPTKDRAIKTLPILSISRYVDQFFNHARNDRETLYQVTRVGCGLAGYKDSDIAPLFLKSQLDNVFLPGRWMLWGKVLPRARLIVLGDDRTREDDVILQLEEATRSWGSRFEVVTDASSRISNVAQGWARSKAIPWTPCPPDKDRFGTDAGKHLSTQLAWYGTHMLAFNHETCKKTAHRVAAAEGEGLRVLNVKTVIPELILDGGLSM